MEPHAKRTFYVRAAHVERLETEHGQVNYELNGVKLVEILDAALDEGFKHFADALVEEGELVTALRLILDQPDVRVFALAVQRDTELVSFILRHDRMPDLQVSATDDF